MAFATLGFKALKGGRKLTKGFKLPSRFKFTRKADDAPFIPATFRTPAKVAATGGTVALIAPPVLDRLNKPVQDFIGGAGEQASDLLTSIPGDILKNLLGGAGEGGSKLIKPALAAGAILIGLELAKGRS